MDTKETKEKISDEKLNTTDTTTSEKKESKPSNADYLNENGRLPPRRSRIPRSPHH